MSNLEGLSRDALKARIASLRFSLREIESMPVSMVNDSESLRHSIATMQQIARSALTSTMGEKP